MSFRWVTFNNIKWLTFPLVGIVLHELMHCVGFWHEQSRADRDDYIQIVWENIQHGMEYNFAKYNWSKIQSLGVNYDTSIWKMTINIFNSIFIWLGSIMHYGPYAFAKDRQKPTIIPLSNVDIGQRKAFSKVIKD